MTESKIVRIGIERDEEYPYYRAGPNGYIVEMNLAMWQLLQAHEQEAAWWKEYLGSLYDAAEDANREQR